MCTDTLVEGGAHCWGGSSSYYSTSSPRPLPRHIQFSYILCAAYHVIVETYAHKCADMCMGPGSTGRVRDTRCTAKNTINSSAPFLFSVFFFCFGLPSAAPFLFFDVPRHISPIYTPSENHLQPNSLIAAQFSQNSLSPVPFPLWLTFGSKLRLQHLTNTNAKGQKTYFFRWQSNTLLTAVPLFWEQIPSCPFFLITHLFFTFSQLPHFPPHFFLLPLLHAPPPFSAFQMPPSFHSHLLYDTFSHLCSVMTLLLCSLLLHKPFKIDSLRII